jgi:hypothetical protein
MWKWMKPYYERWRLAIPTYVAMLTYLIKLVLQLAITL